MDTQVWRFEGESILSPLTKGWAVALSALGVNLALGVLYTWSAFAKALTLPASEGGTHLWTAQQASLPHSVTLGCFAVTMVFAGRLQDRFGPRWVATAGGAMIGLGMIVASLSPTRLASETSFPFWMVLGFGVFRGVGIGLAYAAATPAAVKWFSPRRRGVVTGFVVSGFAFASLFSAAHTSALIDAFGVNRAFVFLGVVLFMVIAGLSQLITDPPKGFVPPGSYSVEEPADAKPALHEYGWRETLRSPCFFILWATFACTVFASLMAIGVLQGAASAQLGPAEAVATGSALLVALALGDTLGRPFSGMISDRFGFRHALLGLLAWQAALLLGAQFATSATLLVAAAFFIGANHGAGLTLIPAATFDLFGNRNAGVNYGLVFTAWSVGALFGAPFASWVFARTVTAASPLGSYGVVFAISAALCLLAGGLVLVVRRPDPDLPQRRAVKPGFGRQA